jgi:hypothetical protein
MRSGILRTYVATLRLRRDSPFPSQIASRQRYRMKARKSVKYSKAIDATMRPGDHPKRMDISRDATQESR